MNNRFLTITVRADWQDGLRAAGAASAAGTYQGEVLNFESPGYFFGQLTAERWDIVRTALDGGGLCVQELARLSGRDAKCVREDIDVLNDLGLLEWSNSEEVFCPYAVIRFCMPMHRTELLLLAGNGCVNGTMTLKQ